MTTPQPGTDHFARFHPGRFVTEHPPGCDTDGGGCPYGEAVARVATAGVPEEGRWRITDIDSEGLPSLERAADRAPVAT